ncbi:MAG: ATPase domain-containing protein [Chloroflexota bacterium]
MADDGKPKIERLTTGVPTLDAILRGGFPVGSLNIITGGPGTGKSTLALQILFHQARLQKKNVYFTSILEPSVKFLRYMQQFDFFDPSLVGKTLFLSDLSGPALAEGLEKTVETLKRVIEEREPAIIAIDSFRALRSRLNDTSIAQYLLYDLAVSLTFSEATALLVGEYTAEDVMLLPEFFTADGIISLSTWSEGLRSSHQLEVLKLRGSDYSPGRHFFDITSAGIDVYPRVSVPLEQKAVPSDGARLTTGVLGLDEMLDGGIPARSSTVLEGGTGTGKTTLALAFLMEGARRGEPGLFFTMDESDEQLVEMAASRGWDVNGLTQQGLLKIVYVSPLDMVGDTVLHRTGELIERLGAKRVVIDSLTALGLSIAAEGRAQQLAYALAKTFRAMGVTSIMTSETPQLLGSAELTAQGLSAIADNILMLRYVEIESRLARALSVVKVRGSSHDQTLRELLITADRVEVGEPFHNYRGVLTGLPTPIEGGQPPRRRGRAERRRP